LNKVNRIIPGFPLQQRERDALEALATDGIGFRPWGAGPVALSNLIGRGWVMRAGRTEDLYQLYAITPEGRLAIEADKAAIAAGARRPSLGARGLAQKDYSNLAAKLAVAGILTETVPA
jgi:hypothetical protein